MPGKQWVPKFIKDLLNGVDVSADGTFAANSDALLPTQKAVKTYVSASSGGALPIHDNTGASSDYALAVGETAKTTYSAATSVPLHIATEPGVYEVRIVGSDTTIAQGTQGNITLAPNNTVQAANSILTLYQSVLASINSTSSGSATISYFVDGTGSTFPVSYALCYFSEFTVSTYTKNKCIRGLESDVRSTNILFNPFTCTWRNTTTVWASLGTLTFPFAQSGTVIIRRIL